MVHRAGYGRVYTGQGTVGQGREAVLGQGTVGQGSTGPAPAPPGYTPRVHHHHRARRLSGTRAAAVHPVQHRRHCTGWSPGLLHGHLPRRRLRSRSSGSLESSSITPSGKPRKPGIGPNYTLGRAREAWNRAQLHPRGAWNRAQLHPREAWEAGIGPIYTLGKPGKLGIGPNYTSWKPGKPGIGPESSPS